MTVKSLLTILLGGVLVNNYVFQRFLGVTPFLGNSKKECRAFGVGAAVAVVMLLTALIAWPVQTFILDKLSAGYLQTLVFVIIVLVVVYLAELFVNKVMKKSLGVYFPLIALNSAVLGIAVNNAADGYNFIEALVASLGAGLGFLLAMVVFSGVRRRINEQFVPAAFRGLPITLLAAGIISLALYAF